MITLKYLNIGADLLGMRFGIFAGAADEPGGRGNCWVSFGGGFGDKPLH
ncbi:hypothetical protein IQ252_10560 [Tychonema sp. LEGE 07203]|nr:hypothetical protein [Tychonema sp. LEGE 07203]